MLTLSVAAVVEAPQLGALVLRIPLAELVAEAEDPLLRPGLLLVAPGAAEHGVEAVVLDRVEQRRRSAAGCGTRPGPVSSTTRPASIDSCTDATINRAPSSATRRSRNSMHLVEVVAGVDVHQRERDAGGREGLLGDAAA